MSEPLACFVIAANCILSFNEKVRNGDNYGYDQNTIGLEQFGEFIQECPERTLFIKFWGQGYGFEVMVEKKCWIHVLKIIENRSETLVQLNKCAKNQRF